MSLEREYMASTRWLGPVFLAALALIVVLVGWATCRGGGMVGAARQPAHEAAP